MQRGFNYYFREGIKASLKTLYRNKCYFSFIVYSLAEFFGRLLIIFNLHFNLANVRQGYLIRKANSLGFSSSFRNVGHGLSFGTYLLTLCLEGLIFLAGIAALALLALALGAVGYVVGISAAYDGYYVILLFAAPAALILLLYIVVIALIFSPTAYVVANNKGISAGETLGACYRSMVNNGKTTLFLTYFVTSLIKTLYLGATGAGAYFVLTLLVPEELFFAALISWIFVALAGYLAFAPVLTLTNRVVREHLFEDIVLDPLTVARVNEKVNISMCNGRKLSSQNLADLFEYAEDPYRILKEIEKKSAELAAGTPPRGKEQGGLKSKDGESKEKPAIVKRAEPLKTVESRRTAVPPEPLKPVEPPKTNPTVTRAAPEPQIAAERGEAEAATSVAPSTPPQSPQATE